MGLSASYDVPAIMSEPEVFLGRQPIVDRQMELVAYELLFRSSRQNRARVIDEQQATVTVLQRMFVDLGLVTALAGHPGFVNVGEGLLMGPLLDAVPPTQLVLELLETIAITPAVIRRCRELKEHGFRLALDDLASLSAAQRALLPWIDYVKLELPALDASHLARLVHELRHYDLQLLAEKVDSREVFERCYGLGVDLFQGYYVERPTVLSRPRSSS